MNWQEVKADFEYDGSLLDLYILDTDVQTWQKLLDCLRTNAYPLTYTVEGEQVALPVDVETVFCKRQKASAFLDIDVHGIRVNCHFFVQEQIKLDIDPREVNTETQFGHLCEFVQRIGRGLGRCVILTPETCGQEEEMAILRYLPTTDRFKYTPLCRYSIATRPPHSISF